MNRENFFDDSGFDKFSAWLEEVTCIFPSKEIVSAQWEMTRRMEGVLKRAGVTLHCSDIETEFSPLLEDQCRLQDILIRYGFCGNKDAYEETLKETILYQEVRNLLLNNDHKVPVWEQPVHTW